jgi:hypothetical protein
VPASPDIVLVDLDSPAPSRRIALYWRTSSVYADVLGELADVIRRATVGLVAPVTNGV